MSTPQSHRNNFDALRLLLALTVIFSHCWPIGLGSGANEPLVWWSGDRTDLGKVALAWFFVFSGYLIAQSWDRSTSARSFLQKRAVRIYPGYLWAVAVCAWLVMPIVGPAGLPLSSITTWAGEVIRFRAVLESPGFAGNPFPNLVDGPLWSISYEVWCYAGLAAIGALGLLRRRWAVLTIYLAAVVGGFVVAHLGLFTTIWGRFYQWFGYPPTWARLLPEFLAGTAAYCWRDHIRYDGRLAVVALIALLAAAPLPLGVEVLLPTAGTYLALYLAFTPSWSWTGATRFGDLSYGVYLYGWPIQQLIMVRAGRTMNPLLLFVLTLAPTVVMALVSWHLVERRFLRRARVTAVEGATASPERRARGVETPRVVANG